MLRHIGASLATAVAAQMGDAERAFDNIEQLRRAVESEGEELGYADWAIAYGNALLQNDRVDDALAWLEPAYDAAVDEGPRAAVSGILSIAYAAAHRPDDARRVAEVGEQIAGGTYSDRMWQRWGEGFARLQTDDIEGGLAALDDADAIVSATSSRVDQAIAALARAVGLEAVGHAHAGQARADARERLDALGISGSGWERVFTAATRAVAPSA
jgi:hypothetical protein